MNTFVPGQVVGQLISVIGTDLWEVSWLPECRKPVYRYRRNARTRRPIGPGSRNIEHLQKIEILIVRRTRIFKLLVRDLELVQNGGTEDVRLSQTSQPSQQQHRAIEAGDGSRSANGIILRQRVVLKVVVAGIQRVLFGKGVIDAK